MFKTKFERFIDRNLGKLLVIFCLGFYAIVTIGGILIVQWVSKY